VCAISGAAGGAVASALSVPLDVIKTKYQLATHKTSVINIVKSTFAEGGLMAFTRGLSTRMIIMTPMSALNFVIFDVARRLSTYDIS